MEGERPVKFGLSVQNYGDYGDPRLLMEIARDAEAAGWDGLFLWDHIHLRRANDRPFVDPIVALAAMGAVTGRIRLGTMVSVPARRRPWKLAREAVTLDHLTGGRLILGVGLGWSAEDEFDPFGESGDPVERAQRLDEALAILDGLWSGEPFSFHGRHHTVDDVRMLPRPLQQPRIPVWVGGNLPGTAVIRRGARWDGVFPQLVSADPDRWRPSPEELGAAVAEVSSRRAAAGLESRSFDVAIAGWPPAEDPAIARQEIARYEAVGLTWWVCGLIEEIAPAEELRRMVREGPWGRTGRSRPLEMGAQ